MELSEFIENTLLDIADGVHKAQQKSQDVSISKYGGGLKFKDTIQSVNFDLAVSEIDVQTSEENKGKAGKIAVLKVFDVGLNGNNKETANITNTVSNRIRFSVPIDFYRDGNGFTK
ncbi:MAG: hypothetical protein GY793_08510 [Proteobacteria bacterium]|nr:hypothetical protein [Pseudomonadota bacterium]